MHINSFILTEQERKAIELAMVVQKVTQNEVAKVLNISQSAVAQIVSGKISLKSEYATRIYEFLGKPQTVYFLVSYQQIQGKPELNNPWNTLYSAAVDTLKERYDSGTYEDKGKILNGLEKLISKA